MTLMELREVTYAYGNQEILKGISMSVEEGKMYAILGSSGCGKTTLLSLMGGLDIPKSGEIVYKQMKLNEKTLGEHRKNNVAFIFQNYNLIDYMTSEENVLLTSAEPPLPVLEKVGLTYEEAKRIVLKLSGGQQQRVAIARALASKARLILADEPTGNLDEDTAREVTAVLKSNAKQLKKCVVVVSHSREIANQADVVFELRNGKIQEA